MKKTHLHLENRNTYDLPLEFQDDDVRFSESLVEHFLLEYTQENDLVFDPFAGFGTTLLVAEAMGRIPLGIEYDKARVAYIRSKLAQPDSIIQGDSRNMISYDLPPVNFSITSPPYTHKSETGNPFTGNTSTGGSYSGYLNDIQNIYQQMSQIMASGATVVIEVANIKHDESITTLAWDIAGKVSRVLNSEGEVIVNWDKYGYGYDHSYCLLFSNPK